MAFEDDRGCGRTARPAGAELGRDGGGYDTTEGR